MTRRSILIRGAIFLTLAIIASVLVWGIGAISGPEDSSEKRFDIGRAQVDVTVQPDASIVVVERLRFHYSDHDFSGAYRDIPVQPGARLTGITVEDTDGPYQDGASTELGSSGDPGTFGVEQLDDGTVRIVWHYDHRGAGFEDFEVGYHLTGVAEAYSDAVLIPAAIWGDQWEFSLDELEGTIAFPEPASEGAGAIQAWRRPWAYLEEPTLTADGATLRVPDVRPKQQVTLSVLYPRSAFRSVAAARQRPGEGLKKVRAREDEASGGLALNAIVAKHILPICLVLVGLAAVATLLLQARARERDLGIPEHLPEPPDGATPAEAYALANEGGYNEDVVLATLLDLVDRGYYDATSTDLADGDDDEGSMDLRLSLPALPPPGDGLLPHEREVREFFDELIGNKPAALSLLAERVPEHSPEWRRRWESMNDALKEAADDQLVWDRDLRKARYILAGATALVFLLLMAMTWSRTSSFGVPLIGGLIAVGIVMFIPSRGFRRLAPEPRERQARWEAFARWTRDFPRLQDDPPATLLLWKRILVYGVAFGTAERVIESGRIPASVLAEAQRDGGWSSGALHSGSLGFAGLASAGSFSSDFSSQVAAEGSSSGSGGGGGGGFSGGGGGGAW